jgi:DNA polymerase III subunit delta
MAKANAKSGIVSALEFLEAPAKHPARPVVAVFGDEAFLKSEAMSVLRRHALTGEEDGFGMHSLAGRDAQLRDVLDALSTISLFGDGRRLVVVEDADAFVTANRSELEDYVAKPARDAILVLEVKSWPSNTRLAKAVAAGGLAIECAAPNERQLKSWLVKRATAMHQVRLDAAAADALCELVPPEVGILAQEVAKLALMAGQNRVIDVELVRDNVGGWRARTTWEMIDAAADGRAAEALSQLDRLVSAGEKPHGLLPQMASTLRRFSTAVALVEAAEADSRRLPLRDALAQAGVLPFKLADGERQLRQIGRPRAKQLTHWLLAADLAMKSHNSADDRARTELERLIVRLAAGNGGHGAKAQPDAAAFRARRTAS